MNREEENNIVNQPSKSCARLLRTLLAAAIVATSLSPFVKSPAIAQQPAKPNILVIFGDDIGQSNISAIRTVWWATGRPISIG
jgi:hypothetical protein